MTTEGYLQIQIRDLKEKIEQLVPEISKIENEINTLNKIKIEVMKDLETLKNIRDEIVNLDINKTLEETKIAIISDLKDTIIKKLNEKTVREKEQFLELKREILNKIQEELYPIVDKQLMILFTDVSNANINYLNMLIETFNNSIKINLPKIEGIKIRSSGILTPSEIIKMKRKLEKSNKLVINLSEDEKTKNKTW